MIISQRLFDSYLAMIRNSIGSKAYKNFFAEYDGELKDGLEDGKLSCAFFVSSVLAIWGAIDRPHATVDNTVKAMKKAGWRQMPENTTPEPGDVLIWEPIVVEKGDVPNEHCGFYLEVGRAVSTSFKKKEVVEHDWQFKDSGGRLVTAIYRGKLLMPNRTKEV